MKSQEQCYKYEKCGCPISNALYKELASQYEGDAPLLYEATSMQNLNVVLKVMDMGCCTEI